MPLTPKDPALTLQKELLHFRSFQPIDLYVERIIEFISKEKRLIDRAIVLTASLTPRMINVVDADVESRVRGKVIPKTGLLIGLVQFSQA